MIVSFLCMLFVLLITCLTCINGVTLKDDQKVSVKIFFRAMCPSCQELITGPLQQVLKSDSLRSIMKFKILPIGDMSINRDGKLECADGDAECQGHKWLACAVKLAEQKKDEKFSILSCIEKLTMGNADWTSYVSQCANNEQKAWLTNCFNEKGTSILKKMHQHESQDKVEWYPHILMNGKVVGSIDSSETFESLKNILCNNYNGPLKGYPKDCPPKQQLRHAPPLVKSNKSTVKKVSLQVIWRAFCPACKWWLSEVLPQIFDNSEFGGIVDLEALPAAGMSMSQNQLVCSSGESECTGHKYFSCAIEEFPEVSTYVKRIGCLEGSDKSRSDWSGKVKSCFSPKEQVVMHKCFKEKGVTLLTKHMKRVHEKFTVGWMPYIIVNGKVLGDASTGVPYSQVAKEICSVYKGDKMDLPNECKRLLGISGNARRKTTKSAKKKPKKMILPCKPKGNKKGAVYNDPPDIGPRDRARLLLKLHKKPNEKQQRVNQTPPLETATFNPFFLPIVGMVLIGLLMCRVSGKHTKYM